MKNQTDGGSESPGMVTLGIYGSEKKDKADTEVTRTKLFADANANWQWPRWQ